MAFKDFKGEVEDPHRWKELSSYDLIVGGVDFEADFM